MKVEASLVFECEIIRNLAILLPGEDEREVLILANRAMGIVAAEGFFGESLVVVLDKLRRIGIGFFAGRLLITNRPVNREKAQSL